MIIKVQSAIIDKTLEVLKRAGQQPPYGHEGIVLWLGKRSGDTADVAEAYEPVHEAEADFFLIPREGMEALMQRLREKRVYVLGQVHSHPQQAFHSPADDEWAVVRHVGALSLVLPWFALRTDVSTFVRDATVFVCTAENKWREVEPDNIRLHYMVSP
ncbi:MAG: Mov34/MPN/PAD-1 family protein [Deltaproteobacteria bacterium]|nr:Mov34/MPN/PAD-1 family protein [Deltaproteobacteria bacterium]